MAFCWQFKLLVSAVGVILEIIFMWDLPSIYALANRAKLLVIAGLSIAAIAIVDWLTKPYISIGFLYLFPVMIVGGVFVP